MKKAILLALLLAICFTGVAAADKAEEPVFPPADEILGPVVGVGYESFLSPDGPPLPFSFNPREPDPELACPLKLYDHGVWIIPDCTFR